MDLLAWLRAGAIRAGQAFPERGKLLTGAVAGLAILGVGLTLAGLTTGRSDAAIEQHRAFLIARQAKGDFSNTRLKAMFSQMDPAAAAVGRRFDPALFEPQAPLPLAQFLDPSMLRLLPNLTPQQAQMVNTGLAFSVDANPAAKPFALKGASVVDHERALGCMTQAIYYEAGFEPLEGAQAVAQVVLNRVRHPAFPKTVCGVVYEGSTQTTGCQFSFTCDGSLDRRPNEAAWKRARTVAERALDGFVLTRIGGATHYHTQWVVPYWAPTLTKVNQIGAHIFYRWPGDWGLPPAFHGRYAGGERPGLDVGGDPLAAPGAPPEPPGVQKTVAVVAPVVVAEASAAPEPLKVEAAVVAAPVTTDAPVVPQLRTEPPPPQRLAFSSGLR